MDIKVWLHAFRLRTLPLALSCVGMGGFLAASVNAFRWDVFLLCILTTILLQILSNLANDYGDSIHGADNDDRKGPSRAVQSGVITPRAMKSAVITFVCLCLISGFSLLLVSFGLNWNAIVFFLALGIMCILAAVAYTIGKRPYGYVGLGDISVLIFFGLVGVLGSFYLFTQQLSWREALPALSCGFFSMGVLNVNNIRDIDSDKTAGKFSIPVRIGKPNSVLYHWGLIFGGLACASAYTVLAFEAYWQWLFLLSTPLFLKNAIAVKEKPSQELDPYLRQLAISTLIFVLLFGIGLVLSTSV